MLPAQFRRRKTRFRLLQNPYYLLFRVVALLHPVLLTGALPRPYYRRTLITSGLIGGMQLSDLQLTHALTTSIGFIMPSSPFC